jgi:hypothetical protein
MCGFKFGYKYRQSGTFARTESRLVNQDEGFFVCAGESTCVSMIRPEYD